MYSVVTEILDDFVSLFFPNCCLACHDSLVKGEEFICTQCMIEMPMTNYHHDNSNSLKSRLMGRVQLGYALALFKFSKSGRVQQILHALKYKNQPEVGVMLGKLYGERMKQAGLSGEFDLIVPVPLHPSRERKRGYNQSAKFAQGLSEKLTIPVKTDLLERVTKTKTQTRKSKLGRWENVSEVFRIKNGDAAAGKRILLVDDVVTTGATLEACANTIHQISSAPISIACIAEA